MKLFLTRVKLFGRYSVSGIISFLLELTVLYILLQAAGIPYYIGVPVAFTLTTTAQYFICHWWVFKRSGRKARMEYEYFFTILFTGLIWATLLVIALVQLYGLDIYHARILVAGFTGLWDFYLNARFNFRAHAFLRQGQTK